MKALIATGAGCLLAVSTADAVGARSERVARYNEALNAETFASWCTPESPELNPDNKWLLRYLPLKEELDKEAASLERKYGRRGLRKMLILRPPGVVPPVCRGDSDASQRFDDLETAMNRMRELKRSVPE